jgi:hypothetical protein
MHQRRKHQQKLKSNGKNTYGLASRQYESEKYIHNNFFGREGTFYKQLEILTMV